MNIQSLINHVRLYVRSEAVVAEIWLKVFVRKFALTSIAILAAVMGLAFVNIALYSFLVSLWAPVWTPLVIGLGNIVLAFGAMLGAILAKPGSELPMAEELRKLSSDALGADFNGTGPAFGMFGAQGGIDNSQITRLLIPAIVSIVGALRRHKDTPKK